MPTRLTVKKRKEIVKSIDEIIMSHRLKIYQQITTTLDQANVAEVRYQIGQMNARLVRDILPMLNELVKKQEPMLPMVYSLGHQGVSTGI